ncbi:glycosyltransferase family 4 protein [Neobacillus niacini]|uniref:glycosyltransferase family 4 protein n=1 Tax=Neobacillus niacini TaxID=86668 RepID=UPI0021CB58F3|nr:glycosyltransferase family 4 protein [Neobacillus niacini]MCM3765951.1 glycosyltransferase family 4 protein [Neobacillus niacini]
MKILIVTTISNTVNAFLIPHIKFLIEKGNEVGVAFNTVEAVSPKLFELGCHVHQIEFQRNPLKKENITAYKKIKKTILGGGYEFVHVHTPVAAFITRLACRSIKNIKLLYTAHGFHFFKGAPKKNWAIYYPLEKIAARWTDGIITINDEDYHAAKKLNIKTRDSVFKVNGVGLDLNKFFPRPTEEKTYLRKQYGYDDKDFILIYVGELNHNKHQDLLITSVNMLKGKIKNIKLLLVGGGNLLNHYKELVSRYKLEETVHFLGSREDVHSLMAISDIAVSTSRREGLPVSIMEAMATGLPIIVTNCRGNRDLVTDGENGLVINYDTWECANAIERLYHSNELRQRYGKNSRTLIKQYSLDIVIRELEEIYLKHKLINNVSIYADIQTPDNLKKLS